jgi:hypothetical protein|tara:strand:+ start:2919 stop:3146 length:228 start_codon:yes stop_codon:yes gene_type:complete
MAQPVPTTKTFNPTVVVTLSIKEYYDFRLLAIERGVNFTSECIGREYNVLVEENFATYCGYTRSNTAKVYELSTP